MTADLASRLRTLIAEEGPIGVDRYMALCLSDPTHGYYRTGVPIGAAGDFITAPEVSQMFGELIGLWCAVVWEQMGAPDKIMLVELGPGRGTLLADALRASTTVTGFAEALAIHLVESNHDLRDAQARALGTSRPVQWHHALDTVPREPALVIANEFFDALPARQVERTAAGWRERAIGVTEDGGLCFTHVDGVAPLLPVDAPVGAIIEHAPAREELAAALGDRVTADGGAALIIDYGHVGPATGDTLQAVQRHQFVGVLDEPGAADLTTHVDFGALARAATKCGATAHGPVIQGDFLTSLGIGARAAALGAATGDPSRAAEIDRAHRRLVDADAMGTLFKVLALAGPALPPPPGFEHLQVPRAAGRSP